MVNGGVHADRCGINDDPSIDIFSYKAVFNENFDKKFIKKKSLADSPQAPIYSTKFSLRHFRVPSNLPRWKQIGRFLIHVLSNDVRLLFRLLILPGHVRCSGSTSPSVRHDFSTVFFAHGRARERDTYSAGNWISSVILMPLWVAEGGRLRDRG